MKTPMQELLEYTTDLLHTFDSEERVAMAVLDYLKTNKKSMLEKEKEQIVCAYEVSHISMMTAEQYYNETFNTKER